MRPEFSLVPPADALTEDCFQYLCPPAFPTLAHSLWEICARTQSAILMQLKASSFSGQQRQSKFSICFPKVPSLKQINKKTLVSWRLG